MGDSLLYVRQPGRVDDSYTRASEGEAASFRLATENPVDGLSCGAGQVSHILLAEG